MTSVGQTLRSERERKGIALAQIAAQLRINERYLAAIEADDPSQVPGGFFYRSFVRQYAKLIGLDAAELEEHVQRLMPAPPPVSNDPDQPAPLRELHPILSAEPRADSEGMSLGLQVGLLVLVILGCAGLYAWWDHSQRSPEHDASPGPSQPAVAVGSTGTAAPPPPQPPPSAPAASVPAGASGSTAPVQAASIPIPVPPAPADTTAPTGTTAPTSIATPTPGKQVLRLTASEAVWVSVTADGKAIYSNVLQPGDSKMFEADQAARLLVGNAGGLEVTWNGKAVGSIGPRGQVRRVVLTTTGVEIQDTTKPAGDTRDTPPSEPVQPRVN